MAKTELFRHGQNLSTMPTGNLNYFWAIIRVALCGARKQMQIALGAASVVVEILLLLLFIWVVYDIVAGTSARRRFARLRALRNLWLRDLGRVTSAAPAATGDSRKRGRRTSSHHARRV